MAVAIRASATPFVAPSNTTTGSITIPSGAVTGDVAHMAVSINGASNTFNTPSGWTSIGTPQAGGSDTCYDFYRVITGTDPGTSVSLSLTQTSRWSVTMDVYSGVDNTTSIVGSSYVGVGYNPGTATATHVAPSYTTTQSCVIVTHYSDKGSPASSAMTSYPTVTGATYTGVGNSGTLTGSAIESTFTAWTSGTPIASGTVVGGGTWTAGTATTSTAITLFALNPASGGTSYSGGPASAPNMALAAPAGSVSVGGSVSLSPASAPGMAIAAAAGTVTAAIPWVQSTHEASQATVEFITKFTDSPNKILNVSASSSMTSPIYTSSSTTPDSSNYVRNTATGLATNTVYYYQYSYASGGVCSQVATTRTLPPSGTATSFNVAFGGCVTNDNTDGTALADMVTWAPNFWIHLGDWHYQNPTSTVTSVHLGDFEEQIANAGSGHYLAAAQNIPIFYNRSDHDAGPSDNGDSDLTDFPGNANSIAATQLFFPVGTLADVRSPKHGLYRTWVAGRVRFIQVDIRNIDRAPGANDQTAAKAMLGATQLSWLETQLQQPEPFKVIISDVAWMGTIADQFPTVLDGKDKWPSYPLERTAIANFINSSAVGHVELWHSDTHLVGYATPTKNTWGGFNVLCAAPFANTGGGLFTSTFSAFYNNSGGNARQYGRVEFTDNGTTITRAFQGWDAVNSLAQVSQSITVVTIGPASAPNLALAAPAGSVTLGGGASVNGVVSGFALAAPAGTVTTTKVVSLTATAAAVSITAPAGTVTATSAGAVNLTPTSPAAFSIAAVGGLVFAGTLTYTFTPTLTRMPNRIEGSLWVGHMLAPTVFQDINGVWHSEFYPYDGDLVGALILCTGGQQVTVNSTIAAELIAAGIGTIS